MASFVSQLSSAEFYGLPCLMKGKHFIYEQQHSTATCLPVFFSLTSGVNFHEGNSSSACGENLKASFLDNNDNNSIR